MERRGTATIAVMTEANQMKEDRPAARTGPAMTASQGMAASADDAEAMARLLEAAIDYRGDVTLHRIEGEPIVGYVFDIDARKAPPVIRLLPADGGSRVTVPMSEAAKIEVTGKDTAAGRSFETWVKKYVERKKAGKSASIEGEKVDEGETHDA